jgi:hypothetical protein
MYGGWPYEIGDETLRTRPGRALWVNKGEWGPKPRERSVTKSAIRAAGDPGSAFAARMNGLAPDVIGIQEVQSSDVGRLKRLLGPGWECERGWDGPGAAHIFWHRGRIARFTPPTVRIVDDWQNAKGTTIPIRVVKQWFKHPSGRQFAVITGKAWYDARGLHERHPSERLEVRRDRARKTSAIAKQGPGTKVVAIDMSAAVADAMAPFEAVGRDGTCPVGIFEGRQGVHRARCDHVFYYSPPLQDQRNGIVRCITGPDVGSDHLFVWADVKIL